MKRELNIWKKTVLRAIIRKPPVLTLDEDTSAIDKQTECIIVKNSLSYLEGSTIILITNRDSTIRFANRVLKLENGVLNETKTLDTP